MFSADYALCQGKWKSGKQENSPPGRGKLIARGARGSGIRITCVINAHPRACPFPRPHEARSYLWLPALIVGLPFDYRSIFDSIQFDHRNEATSKAAQLIRFPAEQVYGQLYILVIYFPTFDFSPQLRFPSGLLLFLGLLHVFLCFVYGFSK